VLGLHDILADALGPGGQLGAVAADAAAQADIARGVTVLKTIGAADIGQACVVQQGVVLAVEAVEGTDAMLARAATLALPGAGGVLVKLAKPGQELRHRPHHNFWRTRRWTARCSISGRRYYLG
jgi:DUF1009 family protein